MDPLQWMGAVRMRVPILSSHTKIHPHVCLELFWDVFVVVISGVWSLHISPDSDEKTFSLEEVILWITDSYLKLLYTDSYFNIWINMDLFLTNTQRIHCWASDIMLHFSKSVLMNKKTNLHLGWPEGEDIFSKFSFLGELFLQAKSTCSLKPGLGNLYLITKYKNLPWNKFSLKVAQ